MLAEKWSTPAGSHPAGAADSCEIEDLVHDLRGPLSVIVAFAESLEGAEREERARYTERLVMNAHRALSVLEEFAALSDLRAEAVEPVARPMDLADVVRRASDDAAAAAPRALDVSCVVPVDGVSMVGDRDLLGMAVRAALRGVAARLESPAALRLHVTSDDDLARVEIRLAPPAGGGRGQADDLGGGEMEILRRVVALHGGRVLIDNEDPGPTLAICIPRQPR